MISHLDRLAAMPETPVVHSHPEIMSGTPVFVGTRVPVRTLLDYIETGDTIESFLEDFPGVSREQSVEFLRIRPSTRAG
ncbi:DUF433 domain-containing protein [Longimicrobium sp.]|uniref:DUF433 domain-containing protein n=1 Tax=Longimicrobium sp. TaxID=2029185 RepID=UPI002C5270A2|nr:DUF433 domain-containing protein [Longimicrobium sp.]HSU15521.1 DUF433 domain-containing protein [Longimicrobium sp.]